MTQAAKDAAIKEAHMPINLARLRDPTYARSVRAASRVPKNGTVSSVDNLAFS